MQNRYATVSVWLHWLMVLTFIGVYSTIELRVIFPRGSEERELIKTAHFLLGLSVFVVVWLRILARVVTETPSRENYGKFQIYLSKFVFFALYALMIVMPLLGWSIVSAEGHIINIMGLELPSLLDTNKDLAHDIEEIHETLGKVGYGLIALHAIAALGHHYIKKDDTLKRMLRFKEYNGIQ
jgi:cytochrome b561